LNWKEITRFEAFVVDGNVMRVQSARGVLSATVDKNLESICGLMKGKTCWLIGMDDLLVF
jgi:hypothetical protein